MNLVELERYVFQQGKVTIPEVQQKFGLKYGEARQAFQQLLDKGVIKYVKGVEYECCLIVNKPRIDGEAETYDEYINSRRQELRDRLAQLRDRYKHEEEEEEEDDDIDLDDLDELFGNDDEEEDKKEIKWAHGEPTLDEIAETIQNKLAVFNIQLRLMEISKGASVTRFVYEVLSEKTRMADLKRYADDIKACVESAYPVRIVAPLSGTRQVAIEIANKIRDIVTLDDITTSYNFKTAKKKLAFAVGTDVSNNKIVADLAEMPHLLVAGTTGSGKSVVLSNLIVSLCQKYSPEYVRFLMVDPKFLDLSRYNGMPHMLTSEAITTRVDALAALDYLIEEMERRYVLFRAYAVGNIAEFNNVATDKLPYLVFIVDELADVVYNDKKMFEVKLMRLAQKSRACGIHMVLATQRPDVHTISGIVKANFPARMALHVASIVDSATIINAPDAEKLIGKGDMLFVDAAHCDAQRLQAAYLTNDDIRDAVSKLKKKYPCKFDSEVAAKIFVSVQNELMKKQDEAQLDPLCKKALRFWLEKQAGRASIASIQRNLGIGFNRAGRIMDSLQKIGYVENLQPTDPSTKPLMVLVTLEDLDRLFPDMPDD